MAEVQQHRETVQPIREKTGGSTFKNPPGNVRLESHRRSWLPRIDDRWRTGFAHAL